MTQIDHPSIQAIKAKLSISETEYHIKPVDVVMVVGYLGRVGLEKATGLDTTLQNILHLSKEEVRGPTGILASEGFLVLLKLSMFFTCL